MPVCSDLGFRVLSVESSAFRFGGLGPKRAPGTSGADSWG